MNNKKNSYPWPVRAVDWIFWRVVDAAVIVTKGPESSLEAPDSRGSRKTEKRNGRVRQVRQNGLSISLSIS